MVHGDAEAVGDDVRPSYRLIALVVASSRLAGRRPWPPDVRGEADQAIVGSGMGCQYATLVDSHWPADGGDPSADPGRGRDAVATAYAWTWRRPDLVAHRQQSLAVRRACGHLRHRCNRSLPGDEQPRGITDNGQYRTVGPF
jgi:hypothetical protein